MAPQTSKPFFDLLFTYIIFYKLELVTRWLLTRCVYKFLHYV